MMHPANLLALLTTVASIVGAVCWSSFKDAQLRLQGPALGDATADASVSAGSPLPEIGTVAEGSNGTMQKLVQTLEDQNEMLKKENQELKNRLAKELEAKTPPPEPADLAKRLTTLRKLEYIKPPIFKAVPLGEIQQRVLAEANSQLTDASSEARSKAYVAMGFVLDSFNFKESMANSMGNQINTYYDPKTNEAFFQDDADLRRIDGRDLVVAAAHRALVTQSFAAASPLPLQTDQDDAATALRCLVLGENTFYRVRWSLQDDLINLTGDGQPPTQPTQSYTPLFFTEQYKFTVDQGKTFVESVLERGTQSGLTNTYGRPPVSTAEILHPELYFANPPFKPTEVTFPETTAAGAKPYFTNVAGEFTTDMMFRYHMSPDLAIRIAEGWAGDRYMVYAGDAKYGDHVLWKTVWRTGTDGVEFFDGMRRILMQRNTIPHQPEYDQPNAFVMTDPHRAIRLRISPDKLTVTVVNATEGAMADALDALGGLKQ